MDTIFTIKNIIIYLIVINFIGFIAMWIDKKKAEKGKWRIQEKTLFFIAFIGGAIGSIAGMYKFRHKTQKISFTVGMPAIVILQIVIIIYAKITL